MGERKPLSKRTRFEVFKRDRFTCQYCGAKPPAVVLHADHILPVAEGGGNDVGNLVTACEGCNLGKGAIPLDVVPPTLEAEAAKAEERREQVKALAEMIEAERADLEEWSWRVAEIIQPGAEAGYPGDNMRSIRNFISKLGAPDVIGAANIAADRWRPSDRRFRYFCGVCWRMIRQDGGDE